MSQVLLSAGAFPKGVRYKFFQHGPDQALLGKVLRMAAPTATCEGYTESLAPAGDLKTVVTQPTWRALLGDIPTTDHILIYPTPGGEMWSYWEFFKSQIDRFVQNSQTGRYELPFDAWREMLLTYYGGRGVALKPGWLSHGWQTPFYRFGWRPHRKTSTGETGFFLDRDKYLDIGVVLTGGGYLYKRQFIERFRGAIADLRDQLNDAPSRAAWDTVFGMEPRRSWDHYVTNLLSAVQYVEYLPMQPGDVILNLGVHTGAEMPLFLAALDGRGALHSIDPLGADHLDPYVRRCHEDQVAVSHIHRLAIHNKDGAVTLADWGDQVSGRDNALDDLTDTRTGMIRFPAKRLQTFIAEQQLTRVDAIKIDVEGGEEYIVPDLAETIERFRPSLAVSVYHKPMHFLTLPRQLLAMCSRYRFYFNIYSWERFEGIWYAIPIERDHRPTLTTLGT